MKTQHDRDGPVYGHNVRENGATFLKAQYTQSQPQYTHSIPHGFIIT